MTRKQSIKEYNTAHKDYLKARKNYLAIKSESFIDWKRIDKARIEYEKALDNRMKIKTF